MILPDCEILTWAKEGGVRPFDPTLVNPASIDLRLGGAFIDMRNNKRFIASEITIRPGAAYLAATIEYVTLLPTMAGAVFLKSSLARSGLDHALAGWVDPAFHGELTLELYSHRPVKLYVGQPIAQLVVMQMLGSPERDYRMTGRYNGQIGPTPARPV